MQENSSYIMKSSLKQPTAYNHCKFSSNLSSTMGTFVQNPTRPYKSIYKLDELFSLFLGCRKMIKKGNLSCKKKKKKMNLGLSFNFSLKFANFLVSLDLHSFLKNWVRFNSMSRNLSNTGIIFTTFQETILATSWKKNLYAWRKLGL